MSSPLDPGTEVMVTVEEPVWFRDLLYKKDPITGEDRWDQAFRDYIRDAMHKIELENTAQRPIISVTITSPPGAIPQYRDDEQEPEMPAPRGRHHHSRVMEVTPGFRDKLLSYSTEPQPDPDVEVREVYAD